ncbi:member of triose phosphate translocator family [Scheffersomyces amazonensis]|uniref:member of triose phosphate translocator family n=1 Tax=Scheffersomyces amazonensis TaxID=1078765 RepID=UPI00315C73A3
MTSNPGLIRLIIPPISIRTVLTCLVWYSVSSLTSQLTKLILTRCTFPLFLAQSQSIICTLLALLFVIIVKKFPRIADLFPDGSIPTENTKSIFNLSVFLKVLPLGLFQFVGRYFSLSATSLIPLATVSSIKALSPLLIVAGYRILYNVRFPIITYLSLTPLLIGVVLMIVSDSVNNPNSTSNLLTNDKNEIDPTQIKGLIFCLISTIIFAGQNIYGKQLMTWDNTSITSNPASLVLNTDTTRPNTPKLMNGSFSPVNNNERKEINKSPSFLNGANAILSKFVRQRNYNTTVSPLPYSSSDLRLDEKFDYQNINHSHTHLNSISPYAQAVVNSNTNVYNPFASIMERFELDKVAKPDQLTIILYCSVIGSIFSFGGFVWEELGPLIKEVNKSISEVTTTNKYNFLSILSLILLDSLSFFIQTLLAFHLLGSIPTLSYSIASMMKRIVIITVSIVMTISVIPIPNDENDGSSKIPRSSSPPPPASFGFNKITNEQFIGLILIGIGLYSYDRWGSRGLKAHNGKS